GVYTQRHNQLKQTDGSLFRGRYKAILIDTSAYLLQVSRYIHRNPVETRKPSVEDLTDYPWSSYPAYINQESTPAWLNRDAIFGELGNRKRFQAYQNYVTQGNNPEIAHFYRQKKLLPILGSDQFKKQLSKRKTTQDIEISHRQTRQPMTTSAIIKYVAQYYQIEEIGLIETSRGQGRRNLPRWVAMKLCQQCGEAKLTD
ncbi:MAG: hypothetical protein GY820_32380, partial [Gammaproteobacteria bacterium]|nr:hypothetical protein [Gammaproteobacteria bacterium]